MNEDLRWLATNVHDWDDRFDRVAHAGKYPEWFNAKYFDDGKTGYTRAQWQSARDELSGKPSWNDAPDNAEYLCQDPDGFWLWFSHKPAPMDHEWPGGESKNDGFIQCGPRGVILCDWRDTLERRPMQCKGANCKRTDANDLDHSPECLAEAAKAQGWQLTGPEDGLPPVGSCCEMEFTSGEWLEVKIEHYSRKHVIFTDQDGEERVEYMRSFKFRPTRTEEDKAVEEMKQSIASHSDAPTYYHALYRDGWRKQEESE